VCVENAWRKRASNTRTHTYTHIHTHTHMKSTHPCATSKMGKWRRNETGDWCTTSRDQQPEGKQNANGGLSECRGNELSCANQQSNSSLHTKAQRDQPLWWGSVPDRCPSGSPVSRGCPEDRVLCPPVRLVSWG
jgi:hypothetical protein